MTPTVRRLSLVLCLAALLPAACHAEPPATAAARVPATTTATNLASVLASSPVGFPQFPSVSPDGRTIVFSWAGDLWAVGTGKGSGAAIRLTAHPALERRSAFSPDGRLLAFESDREGARNIYLMAVTPGAAAGELIAGPVRRVTVSDRPQNLSGFSADGSAILFSSAQEPAIYRQTRMFRVPLLDAADGPRGEAIGGPVERLTDAFGGMPHQSADGSWLTFTRGRYDFTRPAYRGSGGMDIYKMTSGKGGPGSGEDVGGGEFTRLTSFEGSDGDAYPLPDGSVVYVSSRDGQNNLWKLAAGATDANKAALTQLTHFPKNREGESLGHGVRDFAVSPSGKDGVFCVWDSLYRIDLAAAHPEPELVPVVAGADSTELDFQRTSLDKQVSEIAVSPDGKTLALIARGEVFVRSTEEGRPTRRVTDTPGRERDLAWSPDGATLYFSSDDSGRYAIYAATVSLSREDLEPQSADRAADQQNADRKGGAPPEEATRAADQPKTEEKDDPKASDAAKKKDEQPAKADAARKPDAGKRWAEALRFKVERLIASSADERRPLPSPDGKKLLVAHGLGDLVVRDLASGADRAVLTGWNEPEALWAPDSRHILFAREDLDYNSDIFLLDTAPTDDGSPRKPINLTRHPDTDASPRLSADGKVLYFLSERAGENGRFDVWAVSLDRKLDGLRPYELDDYFKKAAEAAKKRRPLGAKPDDEKKGGVAKTAKGGEEAKKGDEKPKDEEPAAKEASKAENGKKTDAKKPDSTRFVADGAADAYLRVHRVMSILGSESDLAVSPGGDRVICTADIDGKRTLISVDWKGEDRKVLDTGISGDASVHLSLTGDKVFYIKGGQAMAVPPGGGKVETLAIDAPVVIDVAKQQRQKFLEAARLIGDRFYHPTLKGLDWPALTERYLSLAVRTRTSDEFNRVVNTLWGELDGSHLGAAGGPGFSATSPAVGYLGVDVAPAEGGYRVTRIVRASPADREVSRLNPGDVITAVDGKPLTGDPGSRPMIDLSEALAGRAGKETLLEVRRAELPVGAKPAAPSAPSDPAPANAGAPHPMSVYVLITPTNAAENETLRYEDEVLHRREAVEKLSDGKIGYLHIRGMSEPSVRDFERDLFAAGEGKLGLIIDVRDNGGGSTADILLASLTAPRHAYTAPRGVESAAIPKDAYPRDRRLIYGWTRPISVLINENSFSNAEIFAHSIQTIGRGKLVGTPTYGGVISTGAATLIDGATIRTPFRGWYLPDGTDMENHGAIPEVRVDQTPEDEAAGKDRQLEAAVRELMERASR